MIGNLRNSLQRWFFRFPQINSLESFKKHSPELFSMKLNFNDQKKFNDLIGVYVDQLSSKDYEMLFQDASLSAYKQTTGKFVEGLVRRVSLGEKYDLRKLIIALGRLDNVPEDAWDCLGERFLNSLEAVKDNKDLICLQRLLLKWKGLNNYREKVRALLERYEFNEESINLAFSLLRFTNDMPKIMEISLRFEGFIDRMSLVNSVLTVHHLKELTMLSEAVVVKFAEKVRKEKEFKDAGIFVRTVQVLAGESQKFEDMIEIFFENAKKMIKKLSERELANLFNSLFRNDFYFTPEFQKLLYDEALIRPTSKFNTHDVSSLLHAVAKLNLDIKPLLPLVTTELVNKCNGQQLCVIFHCIYHNASAKIVKLMKSKILEKIDEISPKSLLNVAKDITEEHTLDEVYWEAFFTKAHEIISKHTDQSSELFLTQFISISVNYINKRKSG